MDAYGQTGVLPVPGVVGNALPGNIGSEQSRCEGSSLESAETAAAMTPAVAANTPPISRVRPATRSAF